MKEQFSLLARYNREVNAELLAILASLPADRLTRNLGAYYGSILGILNHLAAADVVWMRRFAQLPELAGFAERLAPIVFASLSDPICPDLASYAPLRTGLDALIAEAFALLPEERYGALLAYRNTAGGEQTKVAWMAFLHFFNHQTHHRGQISVLLDQLGVDNDYSNLVWKF